MDDGEHGYVVHIIAAELHLLMNKISPQSFELKDCEETLSDDD